MPNTRVVCDETLLRAALVGFRAERDVIDTRIAEIVQQLGTGGKAQTRGGTQTRGTQTNTGARKTHRISAEGRKRIAEAQRRRWAASKGEGTTTAAATPAKRTVSAATRRNMAAAQRRRYAAARKAAAAPKVKTAGA